MTVAAATPLLVLCRTEETIVPLIEHWLLCTQWTG
jgi:hypothetical protein